MALTQASGLGGGRVTRRGRPGWHRVASPVGPLVGSALVRTLDGGPWMPAAPGPPPGPLGQSPGSGNQSTSPPNTSVAGVASRVESCSQGQFWALNQERQPGTDPPETVLQQQR